MDALDSVHRLTDWVTYRECWRIDYYALGCNNSGTNYRQVAYEVKVSLQDFRSELDRPYKRQLALDLSHQFYFAMPSELARRCIDMIPEECGLVEVYSPRLTTYAPVSIAHGAQTNTRVGVVKRAPIREPRNFERHEVAYLARFQFYRENVVEMRRELAELRAQVKIDGHVIVT